MKDRMRRKTTSEDRLAALSYYCFQEGDAEYPPFGLAAPLPDHEGAEWKEMNRHVSLTMDAIIMRTSTYKQHQVSTSDLH